MDENLNETQVVPEPALTRDDVQSAIIETGLFKLKTEYLLIGDEPNPSGYGVVDLKVHLSAEDVKNMKQFLTLMPRQLLWDFFTKKIWPDIPWDNYTKGSKDDVFGQIRFIHAGPGGGGGISYDYHPADALYGTKHQKKQYEDMIWGAFIDLFNESNLEYCNANQIEPWDWEAQKMDAYYVSSSQDSINALAQDIDQYRDVALALDPKAREIMEAYATLPKIGDIGLEINRQNAVKEFLKQKDYATAQAIVDAYRYVNDTVVADVVTQPIPYDITTPGGDVIARKSEGA